MAPNPAIETVACPDCYICGAPGQTLYAGLSDRLYGIPGLWNHNRCPNPKCGLIWLDPMPVPEDLPKLYESYCTHSEETPTPPSLRHSNHLSFLPNPNIAYRALRYGYPASNGFFLSFILMMTFTLRPWRIAYNDLSVFHLNCVVNGRLLEVGCGAGAMLRKMRNNGWDAQGIDFDKKAIKVARATGIEVNFGTVQDQNFPDAHFDAIIMNHVIEHLHDPRSVLLECRRILKPGGQFVIVTPNARSLAHRLFGRHWMPLDPPRHLNIFTMESLAKLAEESGFRVSKRSTEWIHAASVFTASRAIARDGYYRMGTFLYGKEGRRGARWRALEACLMFFKPSMGEELVMKLEPSCEAVRGPE